MSSEGLSVLITGSSGFLGRHLLHTFSERSERGEIALLRLFDLADPPNVIDLGLNRDIRIEVIQGDVRSYTDVREACRGMDVVVHNAAVVDLGDKPPSLLHDVNVEGTRNIIRACKEEGVRCLMYTSSVDAVVTRKEGTDIEILSEYPDESELLFGIYGVTKQKAEKVVLQANGESTSNGDGKLVTCALRPPVMYGEGDPFNVTKSLEMATFGYIVPVKDARNLFQNAYAGNVAWAHLCAMRVAMKDSAIVGGQAYFITDDTPPEPYFDFLKPFAERLGYKYSSIGVPSQLLFGAAYALEFMAWLISPVFRMKLILRTSALRGATSTHTYNRDKAEVQLGYRPIYSHEDAIERSVSYYRKKLNRN